MLSVTPSGHKSRRLDSHQHQPVYKTGAFLSRATSAIKAGVQGVEPCLAVLEAACFPEAHSCNSAFVVKGDRWELNPHLLLHRQTCLPRTPRTPY